jgi:2-methylcitrate dehydratase PrpD
MFGTMCKPFHAGKAAANGLLAATLAQRGFTSNPEVIETAQGFAATHTATFHPEALDAWPADRFAIRGVLFKYHAACFGTHATMEGILRLKEEEELHAHHVEEIILRVPPGNLTMCNIHEPRTALEGKFSLRFTAALALGHGDTTERAFTDERVVDWSLVQLRERVTVVGHDLPGGSTEVHVRLLDGRELRRTVNVNVPEDDLERQWGRLRAKFRSLAAPVIGESRAAELEATVLELERVEDVGALLALCAREG